MTISKHRKKGPVVEILHYATGDSDLGTVLVASTEKGVVAVLIGADRIEVIQDLERRFPHSRLLVDKQGEMPLVQEVISYIHRPTKTVDFPLDLRGTVFQKKVWQAVQNIPLGQTMTYTEVAANIGHPKAIRAVGNACTINLLAFAIPCHRVLHRDRTLSFGHQRGNDRMRPMVEREQEVVRQLSRRSS